MHLGITTMNNLHRARLDDLARVVEERGYESLWLGEHSHIPAQSKTPYPGGGQMPETYKHMADPFVSIAFAAAATRRLRFGLGVALILERELFTLAKEIATLDQLSGGRLSVGIGVGWNREEFANVARMPWEKRFAGLKECAMALRALWTQDEAQFEGRWYRFDKVWSYPKPLQRPHPPLVLGVGGPLGIAMAAQWGDGWFPVDRFKDFEAKLKEFRDLVRAAGRDPASVEIGVVQMGQPDVERLRLYRDLGVQRAVIGGAVTFEDLGEMTRFADRYAKLGEELAAGT